MSNNVMSGIPTVQGHIQALQRIYIWQFYLYVLIILYMHLIAQDLTDCVFITTELIYVAHKTSLLV